ncbi:MAG: DUF938 domain-containing protein [Burkholderiaceae bacterium]
MTDPTEPNELPDDPHRHRRPADASPDARLHAPATTRNRDPILAVLRGQLPPVGVVLEIASGSGEHARYFAAHFPALTWQPSDPDPTARRSIDSWSADSELANLRPALALDVLQRDWPPLAAEAIVCINMIHVAPERATTALLAHAARILAPGAPLVLYGPYRQRGRPLEPSNAAFDADLRRRNSGWGLRDLEDVQAQAEGAGFDPGPVVAMPANNLAVVFRRSGRGDRRASGTAGNGADQAARQATERATGRRGVKGADR